MYLLLKESSPISFILLFLLVYTLAALLYFIVFFYRLKPQSMIVNLEKNLNYNIENITLLAEEYIEFHISGIMYFERHMSFLKLIVNLSPLLGLLGTVLGLVQSTNGLVLQDQKELLLGISNSLVTTAMGIIVSIPALLVNFYGKMKYNQLERYIKSCFLKRIS